VHILSNLFNPQLNNLSSALHRTKERQTALTANLANVNTPGYKRKDVDFAIELDSADEKHSHLDEWRRQKADKQSDQGENRVDGNSVDMEAEIAGLAETELHYQALTEMTNRYFSGLKTVIREGR
jgi:flagellar basal-body rod protein FlgB